MAARNEQTGRGRPDRVAPLTRHPAPLVPSPAPRPPALPLQSWSGAAFGPGYFEAFISMPPETLVNARLRGVAGCMLSYTCWPAFWLYSFERSLAQLNSPRFDPATTAFPALHNVPVGAARAYANSVLLAAPHTSWPIYGELDVLEVGSWTSGNSYSATGHSWMGGGGYPSAAVPGGFHAQYPTGNLSAVNAFGLLWTRATPTTQGSVTFFLNRQPQGGSITWSYVDCAALTPAMADTLSAWQIMDCQHFMIILNTGPNMPMTVYNVSVYQPDTSGNIYSWA